MIAVGVDAGKVFLDLAVHGEANVHRFKNTSVGTSKLVKQLKRRSEVLIVVEATGGYEEAVLEAYGGRIVDCPSESATGT